jgi:hypothetical protein
MKTAAHKSKKQQRLAQFVIPPRGVRESRLSGAGPHLAGTARTRTRSSARRAAVTESRFGGDL